MTSFYRTMFSSVLAIAVILGVTAKVSSQSGPGSYVNQAANRLAVLVDAAAKEGYAVQRDAFSTGGAMINKDTNRWVPICTVQLTKDQPYLFLAAGDEDTMDLDLDIQDASGETLDADKKTNPTAIVSFTPTVSGRYTIRLRLYASKNNDPCYCLATVMAKSGSSQQERPGAYIKEAAIRLAVPVNAAAKQGFSVQRDAFSTGGAMLTRDANRWIPIYTVQLTEGRSYRFVAAGDNDVNDLDIDIQDASGRTLIEDTRTLPTAIVSFTPRVSGRYTVRLRLYDSKNNVPCYCLATVMAGN